MNIYFLLVSACDVCFIIFLYRPASTPHIYSFIHTTQFNRCIRLRLRQSRRHGMRTNIIDVEVAVFFYGASYPIINKYTPYQPDNKTYAYR